MAVQADNAGGVLLTGVDAVRALTATGARSITEAATGYKDGMFAILDQVMEAATDGAEYIEVAAEQIRSESLANRLKERGFTLVTYVTEKSPYETMFRISW